MNNVDFVERQKTYSGSHCWQYDIRLKNLESDLLASGLSKSVVDSLSVSDFSFKVVESKSEQKRLIEFIQKHEWLGNISQYTTHWFAAYYGDVLAGAILMNMPNTFSKMLGEETPYLERLISRGACISWSPKNLASSLVMWSIRWMAKNTSYRLFTAYSDPEARELGTIYQACNFYYLGQKSGSKLRYISPYTGKIISDRFFRQKTAYKKFAKELGIEWMSNWNHPTGMCWENVPADIERILRDYSKKKQNSSVKVDITPKHKYAYVLGATSAETKSLRRKFLESNKTYPYPKERGT